MDQLRAKEHRGWATATVALGLIFAIGGPLLFVVGSMAHDFYLDAFGVPYGLFPLTVEQLIRLGAIGSADRLLVSHQALASQWWLALVAMVLAALFLTIPRLSSAIGRLPVRGIEDWRAWAQLLVKSIFTGAFAYLAPTALLLGLAIILAGPMLIGRSAGMAMAEDAKRKFSKSCDSADVQCYVAIMPSGRLEGHLVAAGPTALALLDPKTGQLVVIPQDHPQLWTARPILLPAASRTASDVGMPTARIRHSR